MKPKVSILIPIYKAQKYIEECLCSVFRQTYSNIELILADDASPDESINIAKEVTHRYGREQSLTIIKNGKNKGIAYTRNILLEHANGDYIYFVDSDDFIEPNTIETLVSTAIRENADIVRCDYFKLSNGISTVVKRLTKGENTNCLENSLDSSSSMQSLSFLFIKRELVKENNLHFSKDIDCLEDYIFSIKLYYYADKIYDLSIPFYHYRLDNDESITHIKPFFHTNAIKAIGEIELFLTTKGLSEKYRRQINKLKFISKQAFLINKDIRNIHKYITTFPESNSCYRDFNYHWKQKILFYLAERRYCYLLKLACKLSNLYE